MREIYAVTNFPQLPQTIIIQNFPITISISNKRKKYSRTYHLNYSISIRKYNNKYQQSYLKNIK